MFDKMTVGSIVRERWKGCLLLIVKVTDKNGQREWEFQLLGEMPDTGYCRSVAYSLEDFSREDVEDFLREDYEFVS